jgi:hypothetical protein
MMRAFYCMYCFSRCIDGIIKLNQSNTVFIISLVTNVTYFDRVFIFQYNKSKGKAHPFETCGMLDWDVIKEKVTKLKERAATDLTFAAALARESGEDAAKIKFGATVKLDSASGTHSFDEERNLKKMTSEVFADSR